MLQVYLRAIRQLLVLFLRFFWGKVLISFIVLIHIFSTTIHFSQSLSQLITSLSFRRILASGFHYLSFIWHIRRTLLWLAFCISNPLPQPFSYCHSTVALGCNVLLHSLWTAMTTCWKSLTKPEGLLSQEGSARLCRWLHCLIYLHEGKQKARLNRGKAAQLNMPERLTSHTVVGSTQFATGTCAVCRDQKW